ncbi:MAG: tyrosine-type recombinase/integrase [Sulfurimonas sp.]|uniref:tyrosine-type recombinase/integrase n=1 Tax=Sulfurimonas sp. TaxID=2022749 RepID=UPI002628C31E|nr:tyrosine-type recombinase/integrase [Sulfurimonas sp.]MDD5373364.1 tyrosine-type recombinase/integrase [Sulfurimonas sp.]
MSNSLLSLSKKTSFKGIYKKETKRGTAFIARFTVNKKTKAQIIGYENDGMSEYDAYKRRLELISSHELAAAAERYSESELYIPKLFLQFIAFREALLASKTNKNYKSIYNRYIFNDYRGKDIRSVTKNDLQEYINHLLTYRRPATVEKIVSAFRKFYLYLQDNGIYKYNPAATLVMPKYDNKKYFSMPRKDVNKFIKYIFGIENKIYRTIYLMLLQGRRINEVLTLEWGNICFTQKIYHLHYSKTKTRKNQHFHLEEFQIQALKLLREQNLDSRFVFENQKTQKPVTYTSFFKQHKKLRKDLSLPNFNIHSIRHLVGFLMVNSGYSLEITAKILGHANIQSTQRYAVLEMEKARFAYKNISQKYFVS